MSSEIDPGVPFVLDAKHARSDTEPMTKEPAMMKTTKTTTDDARERAYWFQTLPTDVLAAIARGDVDPVQMAKAELASRGQSWITGKWVGFERAAQLQHYSQITDANGRKVLISIPPRDDE